MTESWTETILSVWASQRDILGGGHQTEKTERPRVPEFGVCLACSRSSKDSRVAEENVVDCLNIGLRRPFCYEYSLCNLTLAYLSPLPVSVFPAPVLLRMVTTSHMWLLRTWKIASSNGQHEKKIKNFNNFCIV